MELVVATTLIDKMAINSEFAEFRREGDWYEETEQLNKRVNALLDDRSKYPKHFFNLEEEEPKIDKGVVRVTVDLKKLLTVEELKAFQSVVNNSEYKSPTDFFKAEIVEKETEL